MGVPEGSSILTQFVKAAYSNVSLTTGGGSYAFSAPGGWPEWAGSLWVVVVVVLMILSLRKTKPQANEGGENKA